MTFPNQVAAFATIVLLLATQIPHVETGTLIALVSSGVDLTCPALQSRLYIKPTEWPENQMDDDNNGFVDDFCGWDFVNGGNLPQDDYGRGTQVAVIVAQRSSFQILPIKTMDAEGYTQIGHEVNGIWYAASEGCDFIYLDYCSSAKLAL